MSTFLYWTMLVNGAQFPVSSNAKNKIKKTRLSRLWTNYVLPVNPVGLKANFAAISSFLLGCIWCRCWVYVICDGVRVMIDVIRKLSQANACISMLFKKSDSKCKCSSIVGQRGRGGWAFICFNCLTMVGVCKIIKIRVALNNFYCWSKRMFLRF